MPRSIQPKRNTHRLKEVGEDGQGVGARRKESQVLEHDQSKNMCSLAHRWYVSRGYASDMASVVGILRGFVLCFVLGDSAQLVGIKFQEDQETARDVAENVRSRGNARLLFRDAVK